MSPRPRSNRRARRGGALIRLRSRCAFQSVIGLVLVAIGGIIFSPRRHGVILFLAPDNIANIVRAVSETGIIAVGMTFVIITAGIDLSVGALLSLSSVLTATIMTTGGWNLTTTLAVVVLVGAAFGATQGAIISTRFRLEPFIVTLAGLQIARGLALVISDNKYINISYGDGPGLAPPVFAVLGDRLFGNTVPVATLVFLVVAAIATFVLNFTRFGRYVFAVGGNERAARLSGVPVTLVKVAVYGITGAVSAIAGIVHAGQFNFGSANDGTGYELTAIAAVVIGGTSLFGGAGSMVGTVAGAIMLGALANVLKLNNIPAALQLLANGAIIVLAAVLQSLVRRREDWVGKSWRRNKEPDRRSRSLRHQLWETHMSRFRSDNLLSLALGVAAAAALFVGPHPRACCSSRNAPGRTASSSSALVRPTMPSPIASTSTTI